MLCPELVLVIFKKVKLIRERIKTTKSRQKSYVDNRKLELVFEKGDFVFVKISPSKGIIRGVKRAMPE